MAVSSRIKERSPTLWPAMTLGVLLLAGWFVYRPGLTGGFIFDDWVNLPPLGAMGPIDNWHTLVTYLLSGIAGPTGRPVAMLSFLIDANNWPAAPEPFKYTNIMIELLNGALLTWFTFKLAQLFRIGTQRAAWVAVLSAGCWLLHPLLVSTTLFVVQRMAMLAATFVFAGLLCYLHGRRKLMEGRPKAGYAWMSIGIGLFGLLAVLSKENGALLPLFVLVIEHFVLQQPWSPLRLEHPTSGWRIWKIIFIYLPIALLTAYLLSRIPTMLHSYADGRAFTLGERLLTEARVVVHYLYVLLIPRAYTAGLFNDDITVSTSLFHPWTTLPSIAIIAGLLFLGWRTRHRYPALSVAVFFYFAGQLMESTIIPLELYFEHRNYLPAALLFFPLAMWIVTGRTLPSRARVAIAVTVLAILGGLTWTRTSLWGKPFEQAIVWARKNPDSPRAQTVLALHLRHLGDVHAASQILSRAAKDHPDNIMVQLNLLISRCNQGSVRPDQLTAAKHALATAKLGARVAYDVIGRFIGYFRTRTCSGLGPTQLNGLIQASLSNPHVRHDSGWLQNMLASRGELRLAQGRPTQALEEFKRSLAAQARPGVALYEAALLGATHYPRRGLALLRYYETLQPWSPGGFNVAHLRALWLEHEHYYSRQITRVRGILRQDARNATDEAKPKNIVHKIGKPTGS